MTPAASFSDLAEMLSKTRSFSLQIVQTTGCVVEDRVALIGKWEEEGVTYSSGETCVGSTLSPIFRRISQKCLFRVSAIWFESVRTVSPTFHSETLVMLALRPSNKLIALHVPPLLP